MTANPLKAWLADQTERSRPMTAEAWCDRANEHAVELGRTDIRWVVRDGQPQIEWAVRPHGNLGRA